MRHGQRIADGVGAEGAARRLEQDLGEGGSALGPVDDRPGSDDFLRIDIAPFDIGDGDAPAEAAGDRGQDVGVGDRRGVAMPLQPDFDVIDRPGRVGKQDELKVDFL